MRSKIGKDKQDYSLQDQSKLIIRSYDHYQLERDIKRIKYPTYSISNAEGLDIKIQSFKDEILRNQLRGLLANLNSYRKVRGDGNCFFRALAFCYLAEASQPSIKYCFPYLNQIKITCCFPGSIPPDFKAFYSHNFLCSMLENSWERYYSKFLQQSDCNARKALIKLFDQCPFLDFIVILYFRALCLKGLWKFEAELKQFLLGKQQEYIRTYSEETEGVSINICSMLLKVVINVYEIRKGVVKVYNYDNVDKKVCDISLLFYENHYDIIEKNEHIEAEQNSLSKNAFYSDINKKMVEGVCLQCDKQKLVFEDSAICYACFDKIERVAKQYDTEKTRRARCQDCHFLRDDVLEDLGICKRCMKVQNEVLERRKIQEKQRAQRKEKAEKDIKENDIKEIKKQDKKQELKTQKMRGVCIECNHYSELDNQTGICSTCAYKQKIVLQKEQRRRESRQKQQQQPKPEPEKPRGSLPSEEYYGRFKLNEQKSPQKSRPVVGQIRPIKQNQPTEILKRNEADLKPGRSGFLSTINSGPVGGKIQTCESCRNRILLEPETPICAKCYHNLFKEFEYCVKCKYKDMINEQTGKCKKCHFNRYAPKPTNQKPMTSPTKLKYCMKCQAKFAKIDSLCEDCYNKHTCISCKKTSYTAFLINGRCPGCRRGF